MERFKYLPAFALGFILGILLCSSSFSADRSADLQLLELDVARNGEKIAEVQRNIQEIKMWIAASDREKILDAEEWSATNTTVAAHDWGFKTVAAGVVLNLLGLLFLLIKKAKN